jgi:hypothetical protein
LLKIAVPEELKAYRAVPSECHAGHRTHSVVMASAGSREQRCSCHSRIPRHPPCC